MQPESHSLPSPLDDRAAERDSERLLCILAHELRGGLQTVQSTAALLNGGGFDEATRHRASRIIAHQTQEMSVLIDELLYASRLRVGSVRLHRVPVRVDEVVEHAIGACAAIIAARGHEVVLEPAPETIFVEADPSWLSRALQNLIVNASKYSNRGGHVWVCTRRDGGAAVLSVRDTGIGIDEHQLASIFEFGVQLEQGGAERSVGGIGVGLYLVRQLIEAHGGRVEARSAGNTGSEFVCRIPAI